MQMGRVAWGIIAGVVAIVAAFVVQALEITVLGRRTALVVAGGLAGAILWTADHFGLMTKPFSEPTLGLHNTGAPTADDKAEHT